MPPRSSLGIASLFLGVASFLTLPILLFQLSILFASLALVLGLIALITGRGRVAGLAGVASSLIMSQVIMSIPDIFGRPRVLTNENAAMGDLRAMVNAEAAYSQANREGYGSLNCLHQPSSSGCIPGYSATAPTFLDSHLATTVPVEKSGYVRVFRGGVPTSGGNFANYCYQARPITVGETGKRSFGADDSSVLGGTAGDVDCCGPPGATAKLLPVCPPLN